MRVNDARILIAFLFFFILKSGIAYSQEYHIRAIKNIFNGFLYNIHEDDSFKKDSVLHYSVFLDKTIKGGYRLSNKQNNQYLIKDLSTNPIRKLDNDFQLFIDHCAYTENIKAYELLIYDKNNQLFSKKFEVSTNKQQYPQHNTIEEWHCSLKYKDEKTIEYPQSISKIGINYDKESENKPGNILLTDFGIFKSRVDTVDITHPFFDQLTGQNSMETLNHNSLSFGDEIVPFSRYALAEISSTNLYVITNQNNDITIYHDVFGHLLKKYPFYEIKGIDKTAYLADFYAISSDAISEEDYLVRLNSQLKILNDPHFYLMNIKKDNPGKLKAGPVRLFKINEKYHIAACFDSVLLEKIQPGNEVVYVDGRNIHDLLQEKMKEFSGSLNTRHDWALSRILNKQSNDSTLLTYINNKDTLDITLYYNKTLPIPLNFRSVHNEYKYYEQEKIMYIRLNHWQYGDYITLLNHLDDIYKSKGIVFDLRNNSGGNGRDAELMASCFLDRPAVAGHHVLDNIKESHVLFPNPEINLSDKHVVILGNSRTACASEAFIALMKNNDNVFFISDNPTSGAFASRYEMIFPSGTQCAINSLFTTSLDKNGIIEDKGIKPDIWVHINGVNDLAPYEDKLLKAAFKIIDY